MRTETKKFRVILLTHGGADEVLRRLAQLANAHVASVFVETETTPQRGKREKLRRSLRYDGLWATLKKFVPLRTKAANTIETNDALKEAARELEVPIHFVRNYHDAETIAAMRRANADLAVIYGTNIIKETVFSLPRLGSINLHQGLAPYYRGSAPVFWELFNNESAVGITVHRVAAKVDTGDIVLQEIVPLVYDFDGYKLDFESFISDFRANLKERCARLIAEAVRLIAAGEVCWQPQDASLGKRYKLPTKREKDELRRRLRERRAATNANTQQFLRKRS